MHPTLLKFVLCSIVVLGMFGPCSATPARVGAAGRAVGPVPAPPPVRARISQGLDHASRRHQVHHPISRALQQPDVTNERTYHRYHVQVLIISARPLRSLTRSLRK